MIAPTSPAKAPMFAVIVHEKGGVERREVFDTTELTVGRVQGNELMLPKGNVSKRHARLLYREGRFIVTDLNSTNGTYVNRRKISQATIVREGDRIYIGDFVLRIEADSVAQPQPEERTGPTPPVPPQTPEAVSSVSQRPDLAPPEVSNVSPRPDAPRLEASNGVAAFKSTATGKSNPLAADESVSSDLFREVTGTHNVGRATLDEGGGQRSNSLRNVVRTLVEAVVQGVREVDLFLPVSPSLGERIDELLQQAWLGLGDSRELPGAERGLELARCELVEHGPLTELIADPSVSEVGVTRFDRVLFVQNGRSLLSDPGFSSDLALRWAVSRLCAEVSLPVLANETVVERRISPGVRLSAVLGSIAVNGACVAISKARRVSVSLEELVRRGAISRAMATFLQQCVSARVNVLVVGPRDGGVEALLAALGRCAVDGPSVFIGEHESAGTEASLLPNGRAAETSADALRVAVAMPGVRVTAELFHAELCAAVVEAIADGCDGLIAGRYAPSLRRGLSRLPSAIAALRPQLRIEAARELVANAFEVVLEVARLRDGRHRVLRISEVTGALGEDIQTQDIFNFVIDRTAFGGAIEGVFTPSGVVPQVVEALRGRGTSVDSGIFNRPPSR